ncbi:MAG: NHLP leader peptide family natural product precursor [Chloroflexi bacterium]|nr:NHLP leader peptide family natural product precursor [Chloroflexota bacterium]
MTSTNDQGRVQEVLARSAVDSEFRAGLLTDPRATLEKAAGRQMPENLRVKFIEKDSDCDAMYVLPDPVATDELTPEQLEAVAGGCFDIDIGDITICWETA